MLKKEIGLCILLLSIGVCGSRVYAENIDNTDNNITDTSTFYVCDEFLEYGTSGGNIECVDEDLSTEQIQNNVKDENIADDADDLQSAGKTIPKLKMSDVGLAMLEGFEVCRLTANKALSTEKYYTIGYGHYGPDVYEGMTITQEQAEKLLRDDLATREAYLNTFAAQNGILFKQCEFDAILSLIFNIGTGNFSDSTIRRYLIEGFDVHTDEDFVYAISMWRMSGGKVISEISMNTVTIKMNCS